MDEQMVSLATMAGGAAIEAFNEELKNVLENILDVNTDADKVREVTLKVKIKPNERREWGSVAIEAVSKLAPVKSIDTAIYIGRRAGKAIATERNPKQLTLDDTNVAEFKKDKQK